MSAASGGYSEPKQGQRSQSARGFCPRSTMRVPQPDIIEHFGNADAVPHTEPQRGASERNRRLRRLLARRSDRVVYLLDDAVVCKVKLAEGEKQCGCPI